MNKVKTKRIITKKEKNLRKLDIIFIIVCILITGFKTNFWEIKYLTDAFTICEGNLLDFFIILIPLLWMYIFKIIFYCYVLIAVYLAFRITRMKSIKEKSKYKVIDNIEYYRDRFKNITPAEISLITDLEIEAKKDISATILSLYQRGIIKFENNIVLINEIQSDKQLKVSELELLQMIKENDFNSDRINNWKKICIKEAQANNYIKEKNTKEKGPDFSINNKLLRYSIQAFIISLLLGCLYVTYNQDLLNRVDEFDKYYTDTSMSDMEIFMNNPEIKEIYIDLLVDIGPFMILITVMILSFFILIGIPIYRRMKRKVYKATESNNIYERTNESNILVEQIAGIKNYIHDFSLLSEREKEHVMLWEDFLIYAILLEENEDIIKDILKYKNINFDIQSNIQTIVDII